MLMAEFISMYSQISDGSLAHERLTYSMWEAVTLTSNQLEELRRKLTTTYARMETWLQGGLEDRAEIQISTLIISGLRRQTVNLARNFSTFAISWLHAISSEDSLSFGHTRDGSGTPESCLTINPPMLLLTRQRLMDSTSGSLSLLLDLERLERGESCPSLTLRSGGPPTWGSPSLRFMKLEGVQNSVSTRGFSMTHAD